MSADMKIKFADIDIFYLSYDEPNYQEHWADIRNKVPWAKHVHGVEGSDAAHKACANQSDTDRFITVDGDNKLVNYEKLMDLELDFSDYTLENLNKSVISFTGYNNINGLMYGNGGIKCWPKQAVLDMKTHEAAESEGSAVDFCWDMDYIQLNECFSHVYNNATPYQAYRAGFREGVKMSLDRGFKVDPVNFEKNIHDKNYHRLLIWSSVGQDVENGLWALYGTRLGCYMTNCTDWDFVNVRDFEWHTKFWNETVKPQFVGDDETCLYEKFSWSKEKLWNETVRLGKELRSRLGMQIDDLSAEGSAFFKKVYWNPPRSGAFVTEKGTDGITRYKVLK
jgi:hypothetical protein